VNAPLLPGSFFGEPSSGAAAGCAPAAGGVLTTLYAQAGGSLCCAPTRPTPIEANDSMSTTSLRMVILRPEIVGTA
jgi:hypothetical protein